MKKHLVILAALGFSACIPGLGPEDARPIEPGQAPASSALAITADDAHLIIAAEDHNQVVVIDRDTKEVVRTIDVSAGPSHVIVDETNTAYVTTRYGHKLHAVDLNTGHEKGQVTVGAEPMGLTLVDHNRVAVALSGESAVAIVDVANYEITKKVALPDADPRAVAQDARGRLVVSHMSSGRLSILDADMDFYKNIPMNTPVQTGPAIHPNHVRLLTLSSDGEEVVTAHSQSNPDVVRSPLDPTLVTGHDMETEDGFEEEEFSQSNCGYGGCPDELGAVVPTVTQVDLEFDSVVIPVKDQTQINSDIERGFASESPTILNPNSDRFAFKVRLHNPMGAAVVDGGRALLVVNTGTQNAILIRRNMNGSSRDVLGAARIGHGPTGLALTRDGQFAYVFNLFEGSITEIELPVIPDIDTVRNNDALMAKTESTTIHEDVPLVEDSLAMDFENERGNNLPSNTVTILEEVLPPDVAYGRILFHDANDHRISSGATVSCASCHPDGRTDNMTWKFNFGPRNTPQLGGGIMDTAPFHWPGDVNRFDDLETATVRAFMGGEGLGSDMAVVGSFMDHLPSAPTVKHITNTLTASEERGKAIFESAETACASCHSGEDYTNNLTMDIGSKARHSDRNDFQVPVLHGLSRSAPYMHDGSADTLEALVNEWVKTDRMGKGSHLNPDEIKDLIRFLETL